MSCCNVIKEQKCLFRKRSGVFRVFKLYKICFWLRYCKMGGATLLDISQISWLNHRKKTHFDWTNPKLCWINPKKKKIGIYTYLWSINPSLCLINPNLGGRSHPKKIKNGIYTYTWRINPKLCLINPNLDWENPTKKQNWDL